MLLVRQTCTSTDRRWSTTRQTKRLACSLSVLLQVPLRQRLVLTRQFTTGAEERTAEYTFEAGRTYDLEVRFSNFKPLSAQSPYVCEPGRARFNGRDCANEQTGRRGGIRIGGRPVRSAQEQIDQAVKLASESDGEISFTLAVVTECCLTSQ